MTSVESLVWKEMIEIMTETLESVLPCFFLPCLGFDSSPTGLQSNRLPAAIRDNPRWRRARPPCHRVHRRASNVRSGR